MRATAPSPRIPQHRERDRVPGGSGANLARSRSVGSGSTGAPHRNDDFPRHPRHHVPRHADLARNPVGVSPPSAGADGGPAAPLTGCMVEVMLLPCNIRATAKPPARRERSKAVQAFPLHRRNGHAGGEAGVQRDAQTCMGPLNHLGRRRWRGYRNGRGDERQPVQDFCRPRAVALPWRPRVQIQFHRTVCPCLAQ